MASIRKRGNSYQVTVSNGRDSIGKQIIETATFVPDVKMTARQQEKALEKFVFEFEDKVKNGMLLKGEKMSFCEYADQWMKVYGSQKLERTSFNSYSDYIRQHISPFLGHLKMCDIKALHIQNMLNAMTEDGSRIDGRPGAYSYGTIRKCYAITSALLQTAVVWQIVETNPCTHVIIPKPEYKPKKVKNFTLEQAELFMSLIDADYSTTYKGHERIDDTGRRYSVGDYMETRSLSEQLKLFLYLSLFSGSRRGELVALTWDDIDFKECMLSIRKSTSHTHREVVTKEPKNETSNREIQLPDYIINMLKRYKVNQSEYRLSIGDKWNGSNYIFIQWDGKQMYPSTPYHAFKRIIQRYNKTVENEEDKLPDIALHGLRHTSATLLLSENTDITTVSKRLGHSNTSTTMNIYSHALKKKDEKAADTLQNLLIKKG